MHHVQTGVPNWLESVDRLPDAAVVKAFSVQQLAEVKARRPNIWTLHRYWNDPAQVVSPDDTETIRVQRAREWFNSFVDGTFLNGSTAGVNHALATDMVSWWNEYYANSQSPEEKASWWRQERTAARVWFEEYRQGPQADKLGHIRLTIPAVAVGNDIPWQTAETAIRYDCVLDYHAYDHFNGGQRNPISWRYHSGRWSWMDAEFIGMGYRCRWLFGEAGPYHGPVDGWRDRQVCGGDVDRYVDAVRVWIRDVKRTAAFREGRVLGFNLFTTGGGSQWASFETKQPELNALAEMVAQEWTAVPPTPEPPFAGLRFHAPMDTVARVTGRFNDPRNYGLHEGIDFAPPAGVTARALAAADGLVEIVGTNPGGYGIYVRTRHTYNDVEYIVYYAHLASALVVAGQAVRAGDVIGIVGDTGNVTGVHLHITLRVPGYGLPGYVVPDVIDPAPYYAIENGVVQPEPGDPCQPREPYARTYVVLPAGATDVQFAATAYRYHARRHTIGFSYDDAGFGPNLTSKRAILLGIPEAERQTYRDWYAAHYPDTSIEFEPLSGDVD